MNDETGPFDQPKNCASITMRQIFLKDYIMHRTPLILIALIGMLCCLAHEANADSRQGHGIILTVKVDDEDWPPTINANIFDLNWSNDVSEYSGLFEHVLA